MPIYRGRVWKFGDNISTDLMMPGFTEWGKVPEEEKPNYCMYSNRPEFAREVKPGDIIVAGKNFGCGSSRVATTNLQALGLSCLVADSISPIFFRNSINVGFPVLFRQGVSTVVEDGDQAEVDIRAGRITNLRTGESIVVSPIADVLWQIIEVGGVNELLKKELGR